MSTTSYLVHSRETKKVNDWLEASADFIKWARTGTHLPVPAHLVAPALLDIQELTDETGLTVGAIAREVQTLVEAQGLGRWHLILQPSTDEASYHMVLQRR